MADNQTMAPPLLLIAAATALWSWACSSSKDGDSVTVITGGTPNQPDGQIAKDTFVADAGRPSDALFLPEDLGVKESDTPLDFVPPVEKDTPEIPPPPDTPIDVSTEIPKDSTEETDITPAPDTPVEIADSPDIPPPPPDLPPPPPCILKVKLVSGATITDIAAGGNLSCLIQSGKTYCSGRMGSSTTPSIPLFEATAFTLIPSFDKAAQVATDGNHICTITDAGTGQCLGQNFWGQLGNGKQGKFADAKTAVAVQTLTTVTALGVGKFHSCAATAGGKIFCWGYNTMGQLGTSTQSAVALPAEITTLTNATAVVAGGLHSCAIHESDAAFCWGDNSMGQLGIENAPAKVFAPKMVVKNIRRIAVGLDFTSFADLTCHLSSAGGNGFGQLGIGAIDSGKDAGKPHLLTPLTTLSGVSEISANGYHACAITETGALYCWGKTGGQNVATPTLISGIQPFVRVAVGDAHVCALNTAGNVYCWGLNTQGQLGAGDKKDYPSPNLVKIL